MTLWSLGLLLAFFLPHVAGKWRTSLTRCDFNVQSCLQSHRNHQNLRSRYRLRVEIRWCIKHKRGNDEEPVKGWTLGWYLGIFWVVPIVRKTSMKQMMYNIYIYIVLLKFNMYMALAINNEKHGGTNAVVLHYALSTSEGSIIFWWGWWPASPSSSAPLASPWFHTWSSQISIRMETTGIHNSSRGSSPRRRRPAPWGTIRFFLRLPFFFPNNIQNPWNTRIPHVWRMPVKDICHWNTNMRYAPWQLFVPK